MENLCGQLKGTDLCEVATAICREPLYENLRKFLEPDARVSIYQSTAEGLEVLWVAASVKQLISLTRRYAAFRPSAAAVDEMLRYRGPAELERLERGLPGALRTGAALLRAVAAQDARALAWLCRGAGPADVSAECFRVAAKLGNMAVIRWGLVHGHVKDPFQYLPPGY